ncbi:B-cell receptor-associated protein 31-like-domain-containing protein [Radiomyces spectabilis]|uniref:B-cell receptor-associated protein 31-like-domain-containing protein n=1 Tax=Radiomyces spectabilis TaxID=64574 RepID=UPI00221F2313|nr:B-cell receptor-associated protein 31-like-domain-containing protein [Radiomyces spectabilis]KAI8391027.1 B-cell receptor-associated protein 31-like-domain-containing protein [Radiomyces spectabilis]
MAIYYSMTFALLVTEMVFFGVLIVPLPSHWRRAMLKFVSTSPVVAKALYVLKIIFGFIFVLFVDTINRLQRIEADASEEQRQHHDYSFEANLKAKKFYAQRNLYLTGFTLFLSLILERTSTLVIEVLKREEELDKYKSETASVNADSRRLGELEESYKKEIQDLNNEISELKRQERDFETLKKQVEQQSKEYNRLADKHNELERAASGQKTEQRKDI